MFPHIYNLVIAALALGVVAVFGYKKIPRENRAIFILWLFALANGIFALASDYGIIGKPDAFDPSANYRVIGSATTPANNTVVLLTRPNGATASCRFDAPIEIPPVGSYCKFVHNPDGSYSLKME